MQHEHEHAAAEQPVAERHVFPLVAPGVQLLFEAQPRGARRVSLVNHPPYPGRLESVDAHAAAQALGQRYLAERAGG